MPKSGCCLFFPDRKLGMRLVEGRRTLVWLWEECKEVRVDLLEVVLHLDVATGLVSTKENLRCEVDASFRILVGSGEPDCREALLERATKLCTTRRKETVELEFFREAAKKICESEIVRHLKQRSFLDIIGSAESRAQLSAEISGRVSARLLADGLLLDEATIVVHPLEPSILYASDAVVQRWIEYQRLLNEAELSKIRLKLEREQAARLLHQDDDVKKMRLRLEMQQEERTIKTHELEEERKFQIEKSSKDRDKEKVLTAIKEEIDNWNQTYKLQTLKMEADLDETRIRYQQELRALGQKQEELEKEHLKTMAQREMEVVIVNRKMMETKCELDKMQIELDQLRGMAESAVLRAKRLGETADRGEFERALLQQMPQIVEAVIKPLEKMSDIRIIQLANSDDSHGERNSISGIISSLGLLPVVKEIANLFISFTQDVDVKKSNDGTGSGKFGSRVKSPSSYPPDLPYASAPLDK
jgi:hypothetical protein